MSVVRTKFASLFFQNGPFWGFLSLKYNSFVFKNSPFSFFVDFRCIIPFSKSLPHLISDNLKSHVYMYYSFYHIQWNSQKVLYFNYNLFCCRSHIFQRNHLLLCFLLQNLLQPLREYRRKSIGNPINDFDVTFDGKLYLAVIISIGMSI